MLFGLLFFIPILGLAVGAAAGALAGSMSDVGIDDKFIKQVGESITPGTAALTSQMRMSRSCATPSARVGPPRPAPSHSLRLLVVDKPSVRGALQCVGRLSTARSLGKDMPQ
jgi:hypothetical protein